MSIVLVEGSRLTLGKRPLDMAGYRRELLYIMRLYVLVMLGILLTGFSPALRSECRTNVPFNDAIQFDDGPIAAPSTRFPYIAYSLSTKYANFYEGAVNAVMTDECASHPFSQQLSRTYGSARSFASVNASGGKPDFRFRAKGSLGRKEAEDNVANVGVEGKFRFRDVLTLEDVGTDPVNVAVTISMDGNVSLPITAIPVPQQQGNRQVRLKLQDLTFCRGGGALFSVSHMAQTQGPDWFETYVVTVCPTAILRLDLLVDLNATVTRHVRISSKTELGGYTYVDYTQCVTGNSVCFEDCVDPDLTHCSGFSIRMAVVESSAKEGRLGRKAPLKAPRLVSAAGFDYAAPLPIYEPTVRIRKSEESVLVEWPSTANDWTISASSDLANWSAITNQSGFDSEEMMYRLSWPPGASQQYFRLEKP